MSRLPPLFIASSVEGLAVAYAIQENLEFDCEPTVWPQGVFQPSSAALTDLFAASRRTEFAVFVLTPDDLTTSRDQTRPVARDNVVFELGLFVGAIGPQRCFFLIPHGVEMHLPSDLVGVEPLRYVAHRHDGNLRAALGPACNRVRHAMRSAPGTTPPAASDPQRVAETPKELATRLIVTWNSEPWLSVRETLRAGVPFNVADEQTAEINEAMVAAFSYLNSVADGVLSGQIDENLAEDAFFEPLISMWQRGFLYFVPPGADPIEAWRPVPPIGILAAKWSKPET